MKIKADLLRIGHGALSPKGEKLEPEEKPVERVLVTDFDANMKSGQHVGSIPGSIHYRDTAGDFAQKMRSQCWSCKHFNNDAWRAYRRSVELSDSMERRRELNAIRAALLDTGNAQIQERHTSQEGDMDVEHALSVLGICKAMTETFQDPVIVYPIGTCPDDVCGPTNPSGLFVPKDIDSEKAGNSAFDQIMRRAQGTAL